MKNNKPFVSIIIPSHNRPKCLQQCLAAITELDYARDKFEVIVVDDGSSTQLDPIVDLFSAKINLHLLKQEHAGPARARNRGVKQAKGEFLVFTDDDCRPTPGWLATLMNFLAIKPDSMIGGEILNALPGNSFSSASQALVSYLYFYYNKNSKEAHFFTANNIALSKKCFLAVGGFDQEWGIAAAEDREFCDRWLLSGYQMTYAPEAVIYHAHPMSLTGFWDQQFNYGRGAHFFHRTRNRRNQEPMKFEPLSFYLNLIRYPFLRFKKVKAVSISGLIVLAQAANVVGFFWEQFKSKTV
ncbi:glycosyltransferase [candidate division KSB1 bacterium]|nr:glycosyltransferase [candidate division KSB1 bacterium]